jgi:hypothetical protein
MRNTPPASWRDLLADPGPVGHVVQLYQDEDFFGEAVAHFAAEGLARNEAVILVATRSHWTNVSRRLATRGLDVNALSRRHQLTVLDADLTLPKFMAGNQPDARTFKDLAGQTIEKARAGGKFAGVRWWGEMVNVLYVGGNKGGSHRLEQLFDEVAHEQSIAIFCSFLMDKYDARIYDEDFGNVCGTHSHVIAAENVASHKEAVNRAIREVIGEIKGPLFRSLALWSGVPCLMPSSQALLLWVKETLPVHFDEVIARSRAYDKAQATLSP